MTEGTTPVGISEGTPIIDISLKKNLPEKFLNKLF